MHSVSFEAIGVTNQVTVTELEALGCAHELARSELAALDAACSRFRDDSELVRLNAAAGRTVGVSPLLFEALEVALAAAVATDGLVDPTVGGSLRGLGYDRDFDVLVRSGARPTFRLVPATGWRSVQLDRAQRTVKLAPGTELDLGATAKAFAADRIARAIGAAVGSEVLVSLGGDIAVDGARPGGWPVKVTDDHRHPDGPGQVVAVSTGGLATSSTGVRRWRAAGVDLHHIVDPATGAAAAEHWRTVSVAAPSCVAANVAATAAILLGERARRWLEANGHPARLVRCDGSVEYTGAWPHSAVSQPGPSSLSRAAALL